MRLECIFIHDLLLLSLFTSSNLRPLALVAFSDNPSRFFLPANALSTLLIISALGRPRKMWFVADTPRAATLSMQMYSRFS